MTKNRKGKHYKTMIIPSFKLLYKCHVLWLLGPGSERDIHWLSLLFNNCSLTLIICQLWVAFVMWEVSGSEVIWPGWLTQLSMSTSFHEELVKRHCLSGTWDECKSVISIWRISQLLSQLFSALIMDRSIE